MKAIIKEIEKTTHIEVVPCTQMTRRIINLMLGGVLREVCYKGKNERLDQMILARTEALLILELLGGLRVGEATSGGDLHGLLANNIVFAVPSMGKGDGLGETIEMSIDDSKTGPGRHIAFVAVTRGSKLEAGMILRRCLDCFGVVLTPPGSQRRVLRWCVRTTGWSE